MLRGHRSIFVAFLVGAALSGSAPPAGNQSAPTNGADAQIELPLNAIADERRETNKPSDHDEPCAKGADNRSSDLCAQWKAADAGSSGALATWIFGSLGSLIGLMTFAAAWRAAKWAKKAAQHTEAGSAEASRAATAAEGNLSEARRAMALQLRPYVNFTDNGEADEPIRFERGGKIPFAIKNFGQTPAEHVALAIGYKIIPRPIGNCVVEDLGVPEMLGTLSPGQLVKDHLTIDLETADIARIAGGQTIVLRMLLTYTWPGNSDQRDLTCSLSASGNSPWRFLQIGSKERGRG